MTTGERIEEHSFCYDPDFPPDVAEGKLLTSAASKAHAHPAPVKRVLRKCAALVARGDRAA
jgi:hypothetical protein